MKTEELRFGNLVYDTGSKVNTINLEAFKYLLSYGGTNICQVKPIPLTEEWLFKFGFEKYEHGFKEYWQLNDFQLEIHGDKFVFRVHGGESAPHLTQFFAHHTKYVHQLQNLYFTLTGEELTIKL